MAALKFVREFLLSPSDYNNCTLAQLVRNINGENVYHIVVTSLIINSQYLMFHRRTAQGVLQQLASGVHSYNVCIQLSTRWMHISEKNSYRCKCFSVSVRLNDCWGRRGERAMFCTILVNLPRLEFRWVLNYCSSDFRLTLFRTLH